MPAKDYAKFYEMLLNNGVSPVTGERLLSPAGVQLLCKGRLSGLNLDVGMARAFGMAGAANAGGIPRSFNFGWATSHPVGADELVEYATNDHPDSERAPRLPLSVSLFTPLSPRPPCAAAGAEHSEVRLHADHAARQV